MRLAAMLILGATWADPVPAPAWAQERGLCRDPAAYCGRSISAGCLGRLGAAVGPESGAETEIAGGGCGAQLDGYRDCVARAAEQCGAPSGAANGASPDPRETMLFEQAMQLQSAATMESFLSAYPHSTLRPAAEEWIRRWGAPSARPAEPAAPARPALRAESAEERLARELADLGPDVVAAARAGDGGMKLAILGRAFETGTDGRARNDRAAVRLYRATCDLGIPRSCNNLGFMYQQGAGVGMDLAEAARLYGIACDGDEAYGCGNLGALYHDGLGVPQDASEAIRLYRKSLSLDPTIPKIRRNLQDLGVTP